MKLTEKQKRFCDEYIISGNATQSAIKAGYSNKYTNSNAFKLLQNPTIKTYISEQLAEIDSKRIMNAQEAMELLTSIARGEIKETVYIATGDGLATVEKYSDLNQRTNALKELMKRFPMDKVQRERLLKAQTAKLEAEAEILRNKADKLSNDIHQNALLESLVNPVVVVNNDLDENGEVITDD